MINPGTQNNRIRSYLVLDAFKAYEQALDDTEDIAIKLVDFEILDELIHKAKITTQLFTVSAYYLAKSYLTKS